MHELSIVLGIIDIAERELKKAKARKVERIELEVGDLSGVEITALDFAWESVVKNTGLESAEKYIEQIEGRARCGECTHTFVMKNIYDACPECGNYFNEILQGQEMKVKALLVS